jgi:O-antigen/teichoic acid export membrane protein
MQATTTSPSLPELSRRASFGWTLAGRIVYGAAQWGTLVVVAKIGSVTDVGRFSLGLAVTAPVMVFCNMHLRNLYATDATGRFGWATFEQVRKVTALVGLLVCLVMAAAFYEGPVAWVIAAVALAKAVEMQEDLRYGAFQRFGRMDGFSGSLILRAVFGLGALVATMSVTSDLRWAVLAMVAAWGAVWMLHDRPRSEALLAARGATADPGTGSPRALVMMALPMGLMWLIDSLNQNLPRYVVEAYLGEELLGFYVPMTYVVTVGSAFVFALGAPLAPRLARFVAEGNAKAFGRMSLALFGLAALMGAAGVVVAATVGELFLTVAYAESFAKYQPVFVWVMLGGAMHFVLALSMYPLTAARFLKTQAVVYVLAALTTGAAALAWVPCEGLMGAAKASALGISVGAVVASMAVVRVWARLRWRTGDA